MKSTSVLFCITNVANFHGKNADVSRTHWVCHVIYIYFGSSLGIVGYVRQILGGGDFLVPPFVSSPEKPHPE